MNDNTPLPHHDPADADEARVLAVLLGEASPFEAEAVAELLAASPALRAYRDRTAALLGLLPDAAKPDANAAGAPELRLDDSRRAALLAKLRVPAAVFPEAAVSEFPVRGRILRFFRSTVAYAPHYAAAVALLLVVGFSFSVVMPLVKSTKLRSTAESSVPESAAEVFLTGAGGGAEGEKAKALEHKMQRQNGMPQQEGRGRIVSKSAGASVLVPRETEERDSFAERAAQTAAFGRRQENNTGDFASPKIKSPSGPLYRSPIEGLARDAQPAPVVVAGNISRDEEAQPAAAAFAGAISENKPAGAPVPEPVSEIAAADKPSDGLSFASGLSAGGMAGGSGGGQGGGVGSGIGIGKGGGRNFVSVSGARGEDQADKPQAVQQPWSANSDGKEIAGKDSDSADYAGGAISPKAPVDLAGGSDTFKLVGSASATRAEPRQTNEPGQSVAGKKADSGRFAQDGFAAAPSAPSVPASAPSLAKAKAESVIKEDLVAYTDSDNLHNERANIDATYTYDAQQALKAAVAKGFHQTAAVKAAEGKSGKKMDAIAVSDTDAPLPAKKLAAPVVAETDILTTTNAFSTFSLNVSDVSFRLAGEAVRRGAYPDTGNIRSEEFINAQNYRDPAPRAGEAVSLRQEQARHPFRHNRSLLRLSLKTGSEGRSAASPLNLVVLLDDSGSMERSDRRETVSAANAILADNLRPGDKVSVIGFSRTQNLLVDRMDGANTQPLRDLAKNPPPSEGGTNLEAALNTAYAQLARQTPAGASGRVILLTDGAANLGDADPARLADIVAANRVKGRALDAYGIGFDGYNDTLLEQLARKGDGRYAYMNNAAEAHDEFGKKLVGALRPYAADVKVQVEFNADRVAAWRLVGYDNHRLRKEDFRNNKVDAAELAANESGTALYELELKPDGAGDLGTVHLRYRVPGTQEYKEIAKPILATPPPAFADAPEGVRLAACAAFTAESLAGNPNAAGVDPAALRKEIARLAAAHPDDPQLATLRALAEKLAR